MLPQFRTYVLVNNSGQTLDFDANGRVNLKETAWFITPSTGKIDYTQLADDDMGFTATDTITNGSEIISTAELDNTSNLYIGSQLQLEITHDAGGLADGTFDLYISTGDATTELETDASGYDSAELNKLKQIDSLTWHASGLDDELMRSKTWNI